MTTYNTIAETKNFIVRDRYERYAVVAEEYQSEDSLEREFIHICSIEHCNFHIK